MKIKVTVKGETKNLEEALRKFATQAEKEKGLKSPYRERCISRTCDNPLSQDYHSNFITEKEFKR
jgi:hypothetical protein